MHRNLKKHIVNEEEFIIGINRERRSERRPPFREMAMEKDGQRKEEEGEEDVDDKETERADVKVEQEEEEDGVMVVALKRLFKTIIKSYSKKLIRNLSKKSEMLLPRENVKRFRGQCVRAFDELMTTLGANVAHGGTGAATTALTSDEEQQQQEEFRTAAPDPVSDPTAPVCLADATTTYAAAANPAVSERSVVVATDPEEEEEKVHREEAAVISAGDHPADLEDAAVPDAAFYLSVPECPHEAITSTTTAAATAELAIV